MAMLLKNYSLLGNHLRDKMETKEIRELFKLKCKFTTLLGSVSFSIRSTQVILTSVLNGHFNLMRPITSLLPHKIFRGMSPSQTNPPMMQDMVVSLNIRKERMN